MQWIGSVDGISQNNVLAMKLDSNGERKKTHAVQTFPRLRDLKTKQKYI